MYDTAAMEKPYLSAHGLILEIDGQKLIDIGEIHLSSPGVTAVMGPNGAGKSLLMRLLHGLIEPSAGEIRSDGELLSTASRRRQSFVPQKAILLRRSAEANVRFVLKARGLPATDTAALLKRVGLEQKASTPARRLSGGEQQRLAIAQALATRPSTLFLDEPTASLDPRSTAIIEEILRQTAADGTRILLVTHDAQQARRLASDVVFLSDGKVVERNTAENFFSEPGTEQARAYLSGRLYM